MAPRPYRRMKLRGDPREIAARILDRFGYRRTARRLPLVYVGWLVFLFGLSVVPVTVMSARWAWRRSPSGSAAMVVGAMLLTCAIGLVLVALGRRRHWFRGPGRRRLRLDGRKTFVAVDPADGRILGEWTIPDIPGQEQPAALSPPAFAGIVRRLAAILSEEGDHAPLSGLSDLRAGVLRSWILLGEFAGRLRKDGSARWERGIRLPCRVRRSLTIAILATVALTWPFRETLLFVWPSAGLALLLVSLNFGRGLFLDRLKVTDRYEEGRWTVAIRGPKNRIEESFVAEDLVDERLDLVDPAPLDDLAARANALRD